MTVRWTVRAANDRAPQCESQILSPQPDESTHQMVGTCFFITYPTKEKYPPKGRYILVLLKHHFEAKQ